MLLVSQQNRVFSSSVSIPKEVTLSLCCQHIDSSDVGSEGRSAQFPWTGAEVSSRENWTMHFLFWCVCISSYSSFPHLFLFSNGHRLQMQLDLFYITLVPSEIILPFILFTASVAEVFVQSDLSRFPMCTGDYKQMSNFRTLKMFHKFSLCHNEEVALALK